MNQLLAAEKIRAVFSRVMPTHLVRVALFLVALHAVGACAPYASPPAATIEGLTDGLLDSKSANLSIRFDKAIRWETLRLEIVPFVVDGAGNLADEGPTAEADAAISPLLAYDTGDARGAIFTPSEDGRSLLIAPKAHLPVGPKLALLLYAGLTTTDGIVLTYRSRVPFSYKFECTGAAGPGAFKSGAYFFLLNVDKPTATQVKLFGRLRIDEATGRFMGTFTNAGRNRDPNRCPTPCANTEACQLHPQTACVAPSLRAGSAEEWGDFLPNPTPPTGFSLDIRGCAEAREDGTIAFATVPADLVLEQPPVKVQGLVVSAAFEKRADGAWTATGGITGDNVVFGNTNLGPGQGTVLVASVPASVNLPGLPAIEAIPKP